jgi:hypothetical protein
MPAPVTPVAAAAPTVPADYAAKLIAQAQQQYPFIKQYNPMVVVNPRPGDNLAETWRLHDEGAQDAPRPTSIPMDRVGIEVYNPQRFGPQDFAGEFLHVDPRANQVRAALMQSFSPEQIQRIKNSAEDYDVTVKEIKPDMPPEEVEKINQRAWNNAVDSALRGYTVGQYSDKDNAYIGYTPEQLQLLDGLKRYMTTGAQ